ncbi:hypothetical protein E2C01_038263 [Portunus trituberculatus]|uniref:Uncharacterized protein n=1 Tax=Portunus trituberculatus TaxID=210409 RepID=A0A5B7FGT4_PORTR|nr:hypothetical protein [Portunus trituberculatus]
MFVIRFGVAHIDLAILPANQGELRTQTTDTLLLHTRAPLSLSSPYLPPPPRNATPARIHRQASPAAAESSRCHSQLRHIIASDTDWCC